MIKFIVFITLHVLFAGTAYCLAATQNTENIILHPGSSYTADSKQIICVDEDPTAPYVTKDCQYYGGLNNDRCLRVKILLRSAAR